MDVLPTRISQYEIRRVLGQGGMGVVYLALDPTLQRQVALKVLRADTDELRERFRREARLIARLQHPNIVAIYAVGEHEQQPFLAMEYIEGEPLSEGIRRRAPWGLQRKLMMAVDLCAGLAFAHRAGVIHRDVKPSNLMVSNGSGTVRLLDFGIARGDDAAATMGLTLHGNIVGTMNYMSPEQITGQAVDHRSDIFSVGLVLYELLSYFQAFPGSNLATLTYRIVHGQAEPLRDLEPDLDPDLYAIVERAMARRPEDRYPHLEALRTDLLRVASRLTPTAAAALASDEAERAVPLGPSAAPIWSRALDPTIDSAGPVTPHSTTPLRPPPTSSLPPARDGRPAWLLPVAATGTMLGAITAGWLLVRQPEAPAVPATDELPAAASVAPARPSGPADTATAARPPDATPLTEAPSTEARRPTTGAALPVTSPEMRREPTPPPSAATREPLPPQRQRASGTSTPPDDGEQAPTAPVADRLPPAREEMAPVGSSVEPPVAREEPPPVTAATPAVPDDSAQVYAVLSRWARAYAARDAHGIDSVMPGAESTYAKQFAGLRSASSTLSGCQTTVQQARATAACTEQFAFEMVVGGTTRQGTRQRRFSLEKRDGEWRITSTSVAQ